MWPARPSLISCLVDHPMKSSYPIVAVTPSNLAQSPALRTELSQAFAKTLFNEKNRYLTEPELIEFLREADGAVIGRDIINDNVLSKLPNLKIVSKYGVGLDNCDRDALNQHQVEFRWTAGVNKSSVAEMTVCFMLGLFHNVFSSGFDLKAGKWKKIGGAHLTGKTVGIIGAGHIGKEVVRMLKPFHCDIIVNDILDMREFCQANGVAQVGFEELIEQSDIVSLHTPLTEKTRHFIDRKVFEKMKPSAFLINTSRGEVVRQDDLKHALMNKRIAGTALDVFADEPPNDYEFLSLPNLMVTPHIGGSALEAVEAMGRSALRHLVEYFDQNKS